MGTELNKPTVETWFIAWDEDRENIKSFGSVAISQCMATPWNEVDTYTDENEWEGILTENGVELNPEIPEEE